MKREALTTPTCAFCSYRWPPVAPADVPRELTCPICGTHIDLGPIPHLRSLDSPPPPRPARRKRA